MPNYSKPKGFTPSREEPGELDRRTVSNQDCLERVHRRFVQAATSKTRQHTLLVGRRGMGKSHLIEVSLQRLSKDEDLANSFCIAKFPEDSLDIFNYADCLVEIVSRIPPEPTNRANERESSERLSLARQFRASRDIVGLENLIASVVGSKTLLVVVENLDRVFGEMGENGQAELRERSISGKCPQIV
jgi:hypothetical protein